MYVKLRCSMLLQKEGDASKKDSVVLLLQDMLEVVTRDMMVNEIRLVDIAVYRNSVIVLRRRYYPFVVSLTGEPLWNLLN